MNLVVISVGMILVFLGYESYIQRKKDNDEHNERKDE
jgi:hypothetical protein